MSEAKPGDWYCPSCGYLSAARVTHSETCDTCHTPVRWHEVGVPPSVYDAAPDLLAALELAQRDGYFVTDCHGDCGRCTGCTIRAALLKARPQ